MSILLPIIILVWILCGILSFGIIFAYFQTEYSSIAEENRREDYGYSTMMFLFGPLGLIVSYSMTGFAKHGWRIR